MAWICHSPGVPLCLEILQGLGNGHLPTAGQRLEPLHWELRGSQRLLQGLQGPGHLPVACQGSQRLLQILQGLGHLAVAGEGL